MSLAVTFVKSKSWPGPMTCWRTACRRPIWPIRFVSGHGALPLGVSRDNPLAYQIIVDNQPESIRQIKDMVIGKSLRVSDVADVQVGHQDRVMSIGYNQEDAVVITVFRRLGGNTLNISNAVRELLEKSTLVLPAGNDQKRPPRSIQATVVYDQATFVESAVSNVRDAILIGGLFSILILLAFLRSWRATLISALAIPTTLAMTFLFLHWSGETLNLMSLGGLAVAIGLIIDDTVVVIENIARHLSADRTKPLAAVPRGAMARRQTPMQMKLTGQGSTVSPLPRARSRGRLRLDHDNRFGVRAAGIYCPVSMDSSSHL